MSRIILRRRLWALPLIVWTAVVAASLAWNVSENERHARESAVEQGRFIFGMMETFRLWNARHGGVYVPSNEETPPNPYLQVPERDLRTPAGVALTKVNPAYMTRQLATLIREQSDLRVHITSLKPLNPKNGADPWEAAGLSRLEKGEAEVFGVVGEADIPQFRYLAPLITKEACLACHRQQAYRLGDVRGGISVSFSFAPFLAAEAVQTRKVVVFHLVVWLLLMGLSLFALTNFRRQLLRLQNAKAEQDALVELRTAELVSEVREREQAEEQLRLFIESSGEGIYGTDVEGRCTMINPAALRMLGYRNASQVLGRNIHELIHHSHPDGAPFAQAECPLAATYRNGRVAHGENQVFWRADGRSFSVGFQSHPLYVEGRLTGAVVTFSDITERKQHEAELKKLSLAVEHSPASVIITDAHARIEYVNRKFTEATGYAPEEVLGRNPRLLKSGETPMETYIRLFGEITAGREWHGEFLNRKKNGELFWEEASISPIATPDGTITHYVAVKEDITERKRLQSEILHRAHYDNLTGLANRVLFRDRLEQGIAKAAAREYALALLFVDLDGFKGVNDTLGHDAGDELLKQVARRLSACTRESDTVARLGGDEFAIILPVLRDPEGVHVVAGNVVRSLAEPFPLRAKTVTISGSVGAAVFPRDGRTAEALLKSADVAMYEAKNAGKNAFRCFGETAGASRGA